MGTKDLYKLISDFQQKFLQFKNGMIDFQKEMYKFKNDMNDFKQEIGSFKREMYSFRDETRETLNKHTKALISIENTLDIYGDMYKINRDSIKSLEEKVTVLENR